MVEKTAHYTVLARRFRPQTFDDVVGQQHVAQSLRNAIASGRVAHAYLFTGARGVGKTSMARILAKSLNCPNPQDGNPCNQCEICENIAAGHDVDVLEIDGASNRGIDDIRSLRANVNVKSMRTKYKMYIIDEVHMLTKEAFNALLKTLEEPPPNVKFVFCTTEPNKVPDTILSRCQRFDFGTIEIASIAERLQQIAQAEGVDVSAEAIELVARRAQGSMRDSQSIFDQLLAFGKEVLTAADVHQLLGTADDDRLLSLVQALQARDRAGALDQFAAALEEGVQLGELFDQLIQYFRDLMVVAAGTQQVSLTSIGEVNRPQLQEQSQAWGLQTIVAALQILAESKLKMQRSNFGRTLAELALVRISMLEELDRIAEWMEQLRNGSVPAVSAPPRVSNTNAGSSANRPAAPPTAPNTAQRNENRSADEKKNEGPVTTEESPAAEPESRVAEVEKQIPLEPGFEGEILSQLAGMQRDMSQAVLQKASSLAISGPNALEIVFPNSYHFGKQFCERPGVAHQLEADLARLTGTQVKLAFRLRDDKPADASAAESMKAEASSKSDAGLLGRLKPENDPLIQQAMEIFGGSVVKIEVIQHSSNSEES